MMHGDYILQNSETGEYLGFCDGDSESNYEWKPTISSATTIYMGDMKPIKNQLKDRLFHDYEKVKGVAVIFHRVSKL